MADETPAEQEVKPSYLDEVKQVRDDIVKAKEENQKILDEIKKLKTEEILSGKAPATKVEVKVEEDPREYLKNVLSGKVNV